MMRVRFAGGFVLVILFNGVACETGLDAAFARQGAGKMTAAAFKKEAARRIVPGARVGALQIGQDADTAFKTLGEPAFTDVERGRAWTTWFPRALASDAAPYQLDLHTATVGQKRERGRRTVEVVRVTSPQFVTESGVGVGASLAVVRRAFPDARQGRMFLPSPNAAPVFLYDDAARGIAFEITRGPDGTDAGGVCVAVSVHRAGVSVTDTYLSLNEYLRTVVNERR